MLFFATTSSSSSKALMNVHVQGDGQGWGVAPYEACSTRLVAAAVTLMSNLG